MQVMRDSKDRIIGIVDFATKDDMKYALRKLDDTEFKNPFER
jgi:splicing factor, arginine/serine-rich 1